LRFAAISVTEESWTVNMSNSDYNGALTLTQQHQQIIDEYLNSLTDEQRSSYMDIQKNRDTNQAWKENHIPVDDGYEDPQENYADCLPQKKPMFDNFPNKENYNPINYSTAPNTKKPIISNSELEVGPCS
jgi:hypothetical protein